MTEQYEEVPADAVNAFVESTYAETWFEPNEVYGSLEKLTALLVAIDEKPGTLARAVHETAADAETYLEPLEEMGLHVHPVTKPARPERFIKEIQEEYEDELADSVEAAVYIAAPDAHDEETLEAMLSEEVDHRAAGEFYGFPDDCIDAFIEGEGIGVKEAHEQYGSPGEWYVKAFTQMKIPATEEAYQRTKTEAAQRYDALQALARRDDIEGVTEQLNLLKTY